MGGRTQQRLSSALTKCHAKPAGMESEAAVHGCHLPCLQAGSSDQLLSLIQHRAPCLAVLMQCLLAPWSYRPLRQSDTWLHLSASHMAPVSVSSPQAQWLTIKKPFPPEAHASQVIMDPMRALMAPRDHLCILGCDPGELSQLFTEGRHRL